MQMKISDFINQGIGSLASNMGISLVGHQEKDSSFGLDDLDVHQHVGYPKVQCELFHSILEAGSTVRNQSKQLPLSVIIFPGGVHGALNMASMDTETGRLFGSRQTEPQESSSSQLGVTLTHPPASLDINSRRTIYKDLLLGLAVHTCNFIFLAEVASSSLSCLKKYKKRKMREKGRKKK